MIDLEALVPLPEPAKRRVYANASNSPSVRAGYEMGGYEKEPDYYTDDQMAAFRLKVAQEVAKRCAEIAEELSDNQLVESAIAAEFGLGGSNE